MSPSSDSLLGDLPLGRSSVAALCYHNIGGNGMPEQAFRAQMAWLAGRNARTLRLDELRMIADGAAVAEITGGRPAVLLTFDDGFRDLLTRVAPVLREHGFCATVFAVPNRMRPDNEPGEEDEIVADKAHEAWLLRGDRRAWLSWGELCALVDEGVLEAGSHSASHVKLPISAPVPGPAPDHWAYAPWRTQEGGQTSVPRLAPDTAHPLWLEKSGRLESPQEFKVRLEENLRSSRAALETRLGRPARALAWPWGEWSEEGRQAALNAGFDQLFTLRRGAFGSGADATRIPRLEVRRGRKASWFHSRLHIYTRHGLARLYSAARL